MIGEHKGIFHSTLVKEGPVTFKITSDVKKTQKPGGKNFIFVEHDGDEQYLTLENKGIEEAFDGLKDQTVTVTAEGKGKEANVTIEGESTGKPATKNSPIGMQKILNSLFVTRVNIQEMFSSLEGKGIILSDTEKSGAWRSLSMALGREFAESQPEEPVYCEDEVPF